jgi:hypothetical protein
MGSDHAWPLAQPDGTSGVSNHMPAILKRLNLETRTQIGVWAVIRGLYHPGEDDDREDRI